MYESQILDSFPAKTLEDGNEFIMISQHRFRENFINTYPFIQFKNTANIVQCYGLFEPDTDIGEKQQHLKILESRMDRIIYASTNKNAQTGNLALDWKKVDKILKKPPRLGHLMKRNKTKKSDPNEKREGNADTRLGFRWNNHFAVKRFFTFGERKTEFREVHVIQTTNVPLLYYEPKERYKTRILENHKPGQFKSLDQKFYDVYVLMPKSVYLIPTDTIYIIISLQKTFFAINKLKAKVSNYVRNFYGIKYRPAKSVAQEVINEIEVNKQFMKQRKNFLMSSSTMSLDNAIEWKDNSQTYVDIPAITMGGDDDEQQEQEILKNNQVLINFTPCLQPQEQQIISSPVENQSIMDNNINVIQSPSSSSTAALEEEEEETDDNSTNVIQSSSSSEQHSMSLVENFSNNTVSSCEQLTNEQQQTQQYAMLVFPELIQFPEQHQNDNWPMINEIDTFLDSYFSP